jgi:hypothetical protein
MRHAEPWSEMRIAALLVALFTIIVSIAGIVSTDSMMTLRRSYYTPTGLYIGGAVRGGMGLVLILAASNSRWPRTLRALGAMMCLQALAANFMGLERAREILEWEAMHTGLLRTGAVVALAAGGFVAYALTSRPSGEQRRVAP